MTAANTKPELMQGPLEDEEYREYDFGGRVYRIYDPITVYWRQGGSTHRVLDKNGIVHCVPAPGHMGCALRWKNREGRSPVAW